MTDKPFDVPLPEEFGDVKLSFDPETKKSTFNTVNGDTVVVSPDDGYEVTSADGLSCKQDKDGNMTINLDLITAIGIRNLFNVKNITFSDNGVDVDIFVEFKNGATMNLSYTHAGTLNNFSAHNGTNISGNTKEGTYLVDSYVKPK